MRNSLLLIAAVVSGCTGTRDGATTTDSTAAESGALTPPVALDPVPAIDYPEGVADSGVATVRLRLYVDEQGVVVADSTRIAESSGSAALDSAAVAGAPLIRYAPALRNGAPVATAFVQPVEFRRP